MRLLLLPVVVAAALLAGGCDRQSGAPAQGNVADADAANMLSPDEVPPSAAPAAVPRGADRANAGQPAPDFAFADMAGKTTSLAAFRGKPVLVNLWATWCAPCVKELPTLDTLAAREAGKLHVVALSQDMEPAKVAPFVKDKGYKALPIYTDDKMAWMPGVTPTLPTTILYDSAGREVWRLTGDFDWAGAEAVKLIAEAK
ncbi:TlpA family protein disulfide reductase [Sphingomonas sp.]|uniref:TlpA family protein disulfide reductase n=1 Tax=Sphingomonas sp. TaxID=28214 RepID=UPI002DD620F0|nr:redoxin family protein [Sphingomonas sp.]